MVSWYFAYGSNMNPARMLARGLDFEQRIAGVLPRFQMRFNKAAVGKPGIAYANIVYQPAAAVEGVLYQLADSQAIEVMDQYEGSPVRYSREVYSIKTADSSVNAWVYVANPAMLADQLLPESRYVDHLLAGKDLISSEYCQWLENHPSVLSDASLCPEKGLRFNG